MSIHVRPIKSAIPPTMWVANSNFTGDTGGTLDWQIGMEEAPYFGLFGSKKKEAQAREDAMAEARRDHPTVTNCADCIAGIENVRAHIASTERSIQDGSTGPNVGPRYLEAYNAILREYINFFNTNCIPSTSQMPSAYQPTTPTPVQTQTSGPSVNQDPIVQTALPGVTTSPSQTTTGNNLSNQPATSGTGQTNVTGAASLSDTKTSFQSIPKWALYAGGGLAALIVITLLVKKAKPA